MRKKHKREQQGRGRKVHLLLPSLLYSVKCGRVIFAACGRGDVTARALSEFQQLSGLEKCAVCDVYAQKCLRMRNTVNLLSIPSFHSLSNERRDLIVRSRHEAVEAICD